MRCIRIYIIIIIIVINQGAAFYSLLYHVTPNSLNMIDSTTALTLYGHKLGTGKGIRNLRHVSVTKYLLRHVSATKCLLRYVCVTKYPLRKRGLGLGLLT